MKLGTEVGLGLGHIVLDGDPAPLPKGAHSIFGSYLLWPNGWLDQDAAWYGGRPRPRPHCVKWEPSFRPKKGAQPPNFRPICIVAKRSPLSATAEHLFQHLASGCEFKVLRMAVTMVLSLPSVHPPAFQLSKSGVS